MQSKNSIPRRRRLPNETNLGKVMAMRKDPPPYGIKLGFMSFFAKAAANALQRHPVVKQDRLMGNDVIIDGYADISIASPPVTPVLRNVERMTLRGHRDAPSPAMRKPAREGGLKLEDPQGGTFTDHQWRLSPPLLSTPIVNPPQSGDSRGCTRSRSAPIVEMARSSSRR